MQQKRQRWKASEDLKQNLSHLSHILYYIIYIYYGPSSVHRQAQHCRALATQPHKAKTPRQRRASQAEGQHRHDGLKNACFLSPRTATSDLAWRACSTNVYAGSKDSLRPQPTSLKEVLCSEISATQCFKVACPKEDFLRLNTRLGGKFCFSEAQPAIVGTAGRRFANRTDTRKILEYMLRLQEKRMRNRHLHGVHDSRRKPQNEKALE